MSWRKEVCFSPLYQPDIRYEKQTEADGRRIGFASVPEEQTCVFFYTSTGQVACARNSPGFRGDAGMSAGARGAINSIATAEMGRQKGRPGTAGVSQSTGQRRGL